MKIKFFTSIMIFGITISFMSVQSDAHVIFEKDNRKESGSMLAEITQEFLDKSRGNQVLNLNLSAVLLLFLLKAAALGATYIGSSDHYRGRKLEEGNLVSTDEITLALGYLIGDTCLYRAACEVPNTAKEYLGTIEMVFDAMKLIPQTSGINSRYEKKRREFRKAIEYGELKRCPPEYTCKRENIDNVLQKSEWQ